MSAVASQDIEGMVEKMVIRCNINVNLSHL